jgi:hypothetical protein
MDDLLVVDESYNFLNFTEDEVIRLNDKILNNLVDVIKTNNINNRKLLKVTTQDFEIESQTIIQGTDLRGIGYAD